MVIERELLPWTAGPGAQKNFDPEHLLAEDSKGSSLALVLYFCFNTVCAVSFPRTMRRRMHVTMYLAPTADPPRSPTAHALA